jgi:hypothetical protein
MEVFTLVIWLTVTTPIPLGDDTDIQSRHIFPAASKEQCHEMLEAARNVLKDSEGVVAYCASSVQR